MAGFAIETEELTRRFGSITAVDGVALRVPKGSVYAFLGPNGAGKTTTLHLLLGILRPTAGSATVAGHDVATEPDEVRRRCGALLEHHGLYERLTAAENLDFHGRAHRMPSDERGHRAKELLEGIGFWDRRDEPVGGWSKGMKQRLAIARALMPRPEVLFLDEPTNGFDPEAAANFRRELKGMAKREDTTVFLTTHNLHEAESVSTHAGILRNGKLLEQGGMDTLRGRGQPIVEIAGGPFSAALLASLRKLKGVVGADMDDGLLRITMEKPGPVTGLVRKVVAAGAEVQEVRQPKHSLEESFLEIVRKEKP